MHTHTHTHSHTQVRDAWQLAEAASAHHQQLRARADAELAELRGTLQTLTQLLAATEQAKTQLAERLADVQQRLGELRAAADMQQLVQLTEAGGEVADAAFAPPLSPSPSVIVSSGGHVQRQSSPRASSPASSPASAAAVGSDSSTSVPRRNFGARPRADPDPATSSQLFSAHSERERKRGLSSDVNHAGPGLAFASAQGAGQAGSHRPGPNNPTKGSAREPPRSFQKYLPSGRPRWA